MRLLASGVRTSRNVWLGSEAKTINFSRLQNILGSKRRLDRSIPWRSVKLFTTNQFFATTTQNTQNSNANTIDCSVGTDCWNECVNFNWVV